MSENIELQAADDVERSWAQVYYRQTARLAMFACDADSAQQLALLQNDPRIFVPYYLESQSSMLEPGENWQQARDDWSQLGFFNLAVRQLGSGQLLGCVQFNKNNLSYFVHPEFWQQGYGQEMVQASCAYIPQLLGIQVLHTTVLRENLASRKILEKSGFVFSGLAPSNKTARSGVMRAMVLHYRRNCVQS